MKTHLVIDLIYPENDQVFAGTENECHQWIQDQGSFGFEVVPMTKNELLINNPSIDAPSETTPDKGNFNPFYGEILIVLVILNLMMYG